MSRLSRLGSMVGVLFVSLVYTFTMALITLMAVSAVVPTLVTVSGWSWLGVAWLLMFFMVVGLWVFRRRSA